jgi:hypothetical protein
MAAKAHLGLSAGLMGTGMAFAWDTLERIPWDAETITEDTEYHLKLVADGLRVVFVPEAAVSSDMPTSFAGGNNQQERWEAGKRQIVRTLLPALVRSRRTSRDLAMANAAFEVFLPPQTALLSANACAGALAFAGAGGRLNRRIAAINAGAQAGYVLGGLAHVKAPPAVYRALLAAPSLAVHKAGILARVARGQAATTFVRTERDAGPGAVRQPASVTAANTKSKRFGIK